jgi:transcriptional regulator GlxA family with amidase domain
MNMGWGRTAIGAVRELHAAACRNTGISLPSVPLAQLVRLSRYHFSRTFKQSFGMPPHRFHTHRRLDHAKILPTKPSVSMTDVGIALGLSATGSFTSIFRKLFNNRAQCRGVGLGCIDNPGYVGDANARAQAIVGRHRR